MKTNIYIKHFCNVSILLLVLTTVFTACSSDDDDSPAKPTIALTEVGHDNAKHAHPGHDLHLEANIVAEGLIKAINVEIHQKSGGTYKIEKAYTSGKYIGVKNTEFHEHIDIPAETPVGEYHLHLTVTDNSGQQTTAESALEIVEADGDEEEEHEHEHE